MGFFCKVLENRTDVLFVEGCRYLSDCASVLRTFLLYDFGKIDQEEGEDGGFHSSCPFPGIFMKLF